MLPKRRLDYTEALRLPAAAGDYRAHTLLEARLHDLSWTVCERALDLLVEMATTRTETGQSKHPGSQLAQSTLLNFLYQNQWCCGWWLTVYPRLTLCVSQAAKEGRCE